jgi:hypothetical protein
VTACKSSDVDVFEDLTRLWAIATLVDRESEIRKGLSGKVVNNQLGGTGVDSGHRLPENLLSSSSSISISNFRDGATPPPVAVCKGSGVNGF